MKNSLEKTGERVVPDEFVSREEYLMYLRHVFAYTFAVENIDIGDHVLEVGSGEGYGTDIISAKARLVVGIDVDRQAIGHARKKYTKRNCSFKQYPGTKIPFKDGTFDKVVSFQVIEHVEKDHELVAEIYRVLKSGGRFFITTPNRNLRLKRGQKPWNRYHVREYSPDDLENLLSDSFKKLEVKGIFGDPEVQKLEQDRVNKVRRLIALDPIGVRHFLPDALKLRAARAARLLSTKKNPTNEKHLLQNYSIENYKIESDNVSNSLDLLGICEK